MGIERVKIMGTVLYDTERKRHILIVEKYSPQFKKAKAIVDNLTLFGVQQ